MNRIEKLIKICVVILLIVFVPSRSVSATTNLGTNLQREESGTNTITLAVDNFNYETKSFQLELKLEGEVTLDKLVWNENLNVESVVKNYVYDETNNIIKIYVTSKTNLVIHSKVSICDITVKGLMDTTYDVKSIGTFKYLYSNKNKEGKIDVLTSNTNEGFQYINKEDNVGDDNTDSDVPDDSNPGDDNQGDSEEDNEKPGEEDDDNIISKPETEDKEQSSNKPSKDENKKPSKPIKTGDAIMSVTSIAGISLAGVYIFRPRGKHGKYRGKHFKKRK